MQKLKRLPSALTSNCEAEISFHLYTFTNKDNKFGKLETAINRFPRT